MDIPARKQLAVIANAGNANDSAQVYEWTRWPDAVNNQ